MRTHYKLAPLALLALLALGGCRSAYPGPSFAGEWVAAPSRDGPTLKLSLTQDLGAILDAPVRGELRDGGGRTWTLKGDPERQGERGVLRGSPMRVGLGEPLVVITDAGEQRSFPNGPIHWSLVRGALPSGEDAVTLHVGQAGPLWGGVEDDAWSHLTFRRLGAPPPVVTPPAVAPPAVAPPAVAPPPAGEPDPSVCRGCGDPLEAAWRHCPSCGAARAER